LLGARSRFSEDVQQLEELIQLNVLSVVPLSVIPPPSDSASDGDAVDANSIFLSSIVKVVELMVVVVPSIVKSPEIVTLPETLKLVAVVVAKVEIPVTRRVDAFADPSVERPETLSCPAAAELRVAIPETFSCPIVANPTVEIPTTLNRPKSAPPTPSIPPVNEDVPATLIVPLQVKRPTRILDVVLSNR